MKTDGKHRYLLGAVGVIAIAAKPLIWEGPQARADAPVDWCYTHVKWVAEVGNERAVAQGACPTNGACDVPSVRDSWIPVASTPVVTIRVKFNVFCEDDGSNCASPTDGSAVAAQLIKLNSDYAPYRIQFTQATGPEYISDSRYRQILISEFEAVKIPYADDPARQVNVYVANFPPTLGDATFPWDPNALGKLGGIIIHEGAFGAGRSILTHEMGHCLGLWHTHHGEHEVDQCSACYERADGVDGDTTGDFASETPPTPVNFTCIDPTTDDPCSVPPRPWAPTQIENYMGYADDFCLTMFESQQTGRMHCWLHDVLTGWIACTTNEECDDRNPCSEETCVGGECQSAWAPCGLDDGCCGPSCTPAGDADCFCGDGVCGADENLCTCSVDCGASSSRERPGVTCRDGMDNDCDGYADCDDVANCASDPGCRCYDNGGNSPLVCLEWDAVDPPEPGSAFVLDFGTDANSPGVTFVTGNDGWKVWSQVSRTDPTPANLGHIGVNPLLSTANFSLTIAHGSSQGADNVASIALVKENWTGQSNLSGGSIAGDLTGDLIVRESGGQGGVASFTIGGDVNGNVTIPTAESFHVNGDVSSGAALALDNVVGNVSVLGTFDGDICAPNLTPGGPLPLNIEIMHFGPNATICGQSVCASVLQDQSPGEPRNRALSLSVPVNTAWAGPAAIEVRLTDLQNPDPPNAPGHSPPDFSAFEVGSCTAQDETAGCVRWVGPVRTYLQSQDTPGTGSFKASRLQCTPYPHDWSTEGTVHIVGAEILPSSSYEVRFVRSQGAHCTAVLRTARWGDVIAPFNPPSTSTQPDGLDCAALIAKFKNQVGAISKVGTKLNPNLPELNADVDTIDIVMVVDAFKAFAYPFSGPCACPSTVTCQAKACTVYTQHCAGLPCVKTCVGGDNAGAPCIYAPHCPGGQCGLATACVGGANDGDPCTDLIGHTDCPGEGGGSPGVCSERVGFCRDNCGRCSP